MIRITSCFIGLIYLLLLAGCTGNPSYETMVERGLNSGAQNDSLFLGYYFDMPREEFFKHSWEMNQEEKMTGLVKVEYKLEDLKNTATMSFFPEFEDGVIARMPVTISYDAWAPWNEEYWPESLLDDLQTYFKETYDADFYYVYVPELESQAHVSVQGNREIRMYRHSESSVKVDFINLNVYNTLES